MNTELGNGHDALTVETREKLKQSSQAFLRLHKTLLESEKIKYELKYGEIRNSNQYLQLVLDDPHFAWLRKISSIIALIDEATSRLRPATETDAQSLLKQAKILLNFEDADEDFNDKFQLALQNNKDAVLGHNNALKYLE